MPNLRPDDNAPVFQGELRGKTVLVTRPTSQSQSLTQPLLELGASVLTQPAIEIRPPADWTKADDVIGQIEHFGWIVFVSVNGVQYFFDRCHQLGVELAEKKHLRIAAGGENTAEELRRLGLSVHLIPEKFDSSSLAEALLKKVKYEEVLLIRANRGSSIIQDSLAAAGILFRQIAIYENADVDTADPAIAEMMKQGKIDWVTVTSSAIARSVVNLFGDNLNHSKLVSISPTTSAVLQELGFPPAAEAKEFNMAGLIRAITGK